MVLKWCSLLEPFVICQNKSTAEIAAIGPENFALSHVIFGVSDAQNLE